MAQYHMVTLYFGKKPKVAELQPVFDANAKNWLKFNMFTWIVFSDLNAKQWDELVRSHLDPEDFIIVARLDFSDYWGFAPKWIWDWFKKNI